MDTLVAFGIGLKSQFFLLFSLFLLLFIGFIALFNTICGSHCTIYESHCIILARLTIISRNNLSKELVNLLSFFFVAKKLVNGSSWVCWLTMYLKQVYENISTYGDLRASIVVKLQI